MRPLIFKIGQPVSGLQMYVRRDRTIRAKRMKEDFLIETRRGWDQGRCGDWLVIIGGELWSIIDDDDFKRIYRTHKASDCTGPCDRCQGDTPL